MQTTFFRILSNRLKRFSIVKNETVPEKGWCFSIRKALKMPLAILAKRLNVSIPRVAYLEKQEAEGKVTLNTLKKAAEALDCRLFYVFIPKDVSLEEMLVKQVDKKAEMILQETLRTMALEDQVPEDLKAQKDELKADILKNFKSDLWKL